MKSFIELDTSDRIKNRSNEWYTPPEVFEMLRFPEFDLDPASPGLDKCCVPAKACYTESGLLKPWHGRVWLNPPYGDETGDWLQKLAQHGNGIALVFARTDTLWFHLTACKADVICFLNGRIRFIDKNGKQGGSAGCGSMLLAWGNECSAILARAGLGWTIDNRKPKPSLHERVESARKAIKADFDYVSHDRTGQEMMVKTIMDFLDYIEK